jgi:hypothetical protein
MIAFLMRSPSEGFLFQLSQVVSMFVGCVFLTIGLCGLFGVLIRPIAEISFLIEPLGTGPYHDQLYWNAMIFVGVWLILFLWVRLAAIAAIVLIAFKWAVIRGLVLF